MVCMSPSQSTKIIEELTDGHDADVLYWRDEIAKVSELQVELKHVYTAYTLEC